MACNNSSLVLSTLLCSTKPFTITLWNTTNLVSIFLFWEAQALSALFLSGTMLPGSKACVLRCVLSGRLGNISWRRNIDFPCFEVSSSKQPSSIPSRSVSDLPAPGEWRPNGGRQQGTSVWNECCSGFPSPVRGAYVLGLQPALTGNVFDLTFFQFSCLDLFPVAPGNTLQITSGSSFSWYAFSIVFFSLFLFKFWYFKGFSPSNSCFLFTQYSTSWPRNSSLFFLSRHESHWNVVV